MCSVRKWKKGEKPTVRGREGMKMGWCLPLFSGAGISPSLWGKKRQHRIHSRVRPLGMREDNYGSISRLEAIALKIVQLRALVVYFRFRTGTHATKRIQKTGNVCKAACVSLSHTSDTNLSCRMMGSLSHPKCHSDPLSQPCGKTSHGKIVAIKQNFM